MHVEIFVGDITKVKTTAIVNAANKSLLKGSGVCGAIFNAAGSDMLKAECAKLGPIETGEAVFTSGFNLPAKYIIHTVGPIFDENKKEESEKLLGNAYTNSMRIALSLKCESIAFPLISSGIYGYPVKDAFNVAVNSIEKFLESKDSNMKAYIVLYNEDIKVQCLN